MWAPGGPLAAIGLIPMSDHARTRFAETIRGGTPLDESALL